MRYYVGLLAMVMTPTPPLAAGTVHRIGDDTRCSVALAYIETVLSGERGKQLVFSDERESVSYPLTAGGWSVPEHGTRSPAPPSSLLAEARKRGGQSAVKYCPSIRARLSVAGIAYGSKAVADASKTARGRDFRYNVKIIGVSTPVVSDDKRKAVFYSSQVSGPLAGGAYVYYMKRSPLGKWIVVGSKVVTTA